MTHRILVLAVCMIWLRPALVNAERPNFLIIMVDDMGYSDLGCYGSEIETPNLNDLASNGLRFSQFYNTAKCHSSRVCLLTGQYCLAAGDTSMKHSVTSAETLARAGYATAMTGKWHLDAQPTDFGFQHYFGHLSGACNFFYGDQTFRLNGDRFQVPKQGFYTTVANVDYAIRFLTEARATSNPWYLYVAFNAPHAPLHALPEDYAKYQGRYDAGWDAIRENRVHGLKKHGILSSQDVACPRPSHIPAWDSMEPWRQTYESNRMATLAAMIDRVDQEVGRLVDDLRKHDELENTVILFVSDNGACPYDRKRPVLNVTPTSGDVAYGDSTGWAWARNTPFRYYKQNQFEGGIATPGIIHWPSGLKTEPGSINHDAVHLIDVLPTMMDLANCRRPDSWPDRELRPVSGVSLKPILDGGELPDRAPIHFLFASDRAMREGDWKIVSFRGKAWELYNLRDDRTEQHNLASQHPDRLHSMVQEWTEMSRDILKARPLSYSAVSTDTSEHLHPEWTSFQGMAQNYRALQKGSGGKTKHARNRIRARKNTKLAIVDGGLILRFDGDDPGIAMDLRQADFPPGPYQLRFQLKRNGDDDIDVFFTTDMKTTLPRGSQVTKSLPKSSDLQQVSIDLETEKTIRQLRIDVSDGKGTATITKLRLEKLGKVIQSWPAP